MSATPERNVGRAWSEEEDGLLTEAVRIHGERDNWKTIALSVPGRSNKACRKRWLHSLSPTVKKTAWTSDEDRQLLALYEQLGPKWSAIARGIPGRTDDACSKRYREALDPNLKKDVWAPEEDTKLMEVFTRIGGKWGQVGHELQRSGLACRNRWRLLERKKSHRNLQGNGIHHTAQPHIVIYEPSPYKDIQSPLLLTTSAEESISPLANWSPFYSPEHFTTQLEDSYPIADDFVSTSSEVQNAPFQFSSSSLSAALSDPQHYGTLSPIPNLMEDRCDQEFPSSSVSPAGSNNHLISNLEEQQMLMCDTSSFRDSLDLGHIFSQVGFNSPAIHNDQALDINEAMVSPLFSPQDMAQPNALPPQGSPWTPSTPFEAFGLSPVEHPQHLQHLNGFFGDDGIYDDLSSTTSTPINFISSLSPNSSPNAISLVDLPSNDPHTSGSLLFSPTQRPREPVSNTHKRPRRTIARRMLRPLGTTRLSANLAITSDPSIKPYACGREKCWPSDADVSSACYSTSKELFDHCKTEHEFDPAGESPFRCALAGCNKSWKTLNGLQYHLQISPAHFLYALSTKFSSQQLRSERAQGTSATGSNSDTEATDDSKRIHVCHYPNCFKAYKQPSGLRYHLKHGHPVNMPAQLPVVPPVLARQLPVKAKKMRRRASAGIEPRQHQQDSI
ncbi:hypothetical protein AX15_001765 [Amanita polypyramis BW_CC]|nr:hypothetical protein AX15_001765 [Amanita polypyramis BW_CC]